MAQDNWRSAIEIPPPEWKCPAGPFWSAALDAHLQGDRTCAARAHRNVCQHFTALPAS